MDIESKEDILITINDIPEGFGLAEKIGDIYSPVGATDPFGTTTLFSVQIPTIQLIKMKTSIQF